MNAINNFGPSRPGNYCFLLLALYMPVYVRSTAFYIDMNNARSVISWQSFARHRLARAPHSTCYTNA
jgi:hypothetical protein